MFCVCLATAGAARAGDPWEARPEINVFIQSSRTTRFFLDAAYAEERETPSRALDLAAYFDISIKPIGIGDRARFRHEDWARNRYLWARIGYDHIFKGEGGTPAPPEDRGILSLWAKAPLPASVWLEGRGRVDLRWIEGAFSRRYRLRIEATREFVLAGHPVNPYVNAEWFYDTRYDGWANLVYQGGSEFTVNRRFRFEIYLARQENRLPTESALNAVGAVVKWYF